MATILGVFCDDFDDFLGVVFITCFDLRFHYIFKHFETIFNAILASIRYRCEERSANM